MYPNIAVTVNVNNPNTNVNNPNTNFNNTNTVPFPRANGNLVPSDRFVNKNVTVTIGILGAYTFGQLKPLGEPVRNLPPAPESNKCKDAQLVKKLARNECQELLIKWASDSCCKKSAKEAKECHISDCYNYNAFQLTLETFTEKRSIVCDLTTCRNGENIDVPTSPLNDLWSIPMQPDRLYVNHTKFYTLPHTETIHVCMGCDGNGICRCSGCGGSGTSVCAFCGGDGKKEHFDAQTNRSIVERCGFCGGSGRTVCRRCNGSGKVNCNTCQSSGWLKFFLKLQVDYINHVDEYLNEKTELDDNIIKNVPGQILVADEGVQINPIKNCNADDINQNSARLIQAAINGYRFERQIMQKHELRCISCHVCKCQYNDKKFTFWIVGENNELICYEYPGMGCCRCCGCTLI